jgi:hypothetical protein
MAQPTTLKFGAGALYIESSTTPGTFNKICGFDKIEFGISKDKNDSNVPDCDNPDAPAWKARDVVAFSGEFSASGVLAKEAYPEIRAAVLSANSRNCRILMTGLGATGPLPNHRVSGKFHIDMKISGELGNKFQIELTGESDQEVLFTDVATV